MEDLTQRRAARGSAPERLAIEVVAGPDAGATARAEDDALTVGSATGNTLVLSDPTVSRYHTELARVAAGVRVRDLGSTNGILVGAVRVRDAVVPVGTSLALGDTTLRVVDGGAAASELLGADALAGLRGRTPVMRQLMARIAKVARSDVGVLLTGESGTGKELAAEALHELGPRSRGPFVTVDCGALAPTLVASELFGHERGAFTGAESRRTGAFEQADGGTLFLDEVGELPSMLQASLPGVLERRRASARRCRGGRKSGWSRRRTGPARGRERRPLPARSLHRLSVVTLRMPPLRERVEDIPCSSSTLEDAGRRRRSRSS
ncbi:MAG: sigma 54-interacting transcriptional regulator [Sandaracinaceae bacterium]